MTANASAAHARKCRFRTCPKKIVSPQTCILEDRQSSIGCLRGRRQGRSLENPPPPSNGRVERRAELCGLFLAYIFLSQSPPPCRQPRNTSPIFLPFSLLTSASIFYSFSNPLQTSQSRPKSFKKLPKPSPRPSQNYIKTASYLATPEILKKYNPPIRNPNF